MNNQLTDTERAADALISIENDQIARHLSEASNNHFTARVPAQPSQPRRDSGNTD